MPAPDSRRTDHPYLVDRLEDLPEGLQQLAGQGLAAGETAETIFAMPAQWLPMDFGRRGGMHLVPERALLFTGRGALYVQGAGRSGEPGQAIYLPGSQLFYTRLIQVLLYGRLEFYIAAGDRLRRIVVEYNTVGHDLLKPALQRFLRLAWEQKPSGRPSPGVDQTETMLQALGEQSYKFRGGLQGYGLLPGECLRGFVFQPRITQRILGIFPRLIAPAAVFALTEKSFVAIEEGRTNATSYGWFVTYCPRHYVSGVSVAPHAQWQDVCIQLKKGNIQEKYLATVEEKSALALRGLWRGEMLNTELTHHGSRFRGVS